jgi:hypothetical protein
MHPRVKGISGKYFAKCNIANPSSRASDVELAKKLWQFSLQTVFLMSCLCKPFLEKIAVFDVNIGILRCILMYSYINNSLV